MALLFWSDRSVRVVGGGGLTYRINTRGIDAITPMFEIIKHDSVALFNRNRSVQLLKLSFATLFRCLHMYTLLCEDFFEIKR